MSESKLTSDRHAWSGSVTGVVGESFKNLAEKGPADEMLIQITTNIDLGLPLKLRDEAAISAKGQDPKKRGFEIFSGNSGVRLDRFLTELKLNGFSYEDGHAFKKPGRTDPTNNLRFARSSTRALTLPEKVQQLLVDRGFNGFWLHANFLESGLRRDCINCSVSKGEVKRGTQLVFHGPTKGDYRLVSTPRPVERRPVADIALELGVHVNTLLETCDVLNIRPTADDMLLVRFIERITTALKPPTVEGPKTA